ncbi:outer membrane protein [Caulobacter sp. BP25]|uniref:outer membrane protein n=1 Tax=Caulobacter sp. BP25 TaxID=2048900 RepID=UPI0013747437|nr:outer membrane beta-barrel protein [Caulobacter sp. BP25]
MLVSLTVISLSAAQNAAAQTQGQAPAETGLYAVGRVGGVVSPKQDIDVDNLSAAFPNDAKYKTGLTGEIGGGYDFGRFRVEQTIGYASSDVNSGKLASSGLNGDGRTRSLNIIVSGYLDIPVTDRIVPYVGGGAGAARVETRLTGVGARGLTTGFDGKDWGLLWHADAGVGYRLNPKMTLELGARYSQVSRLKYDGVNAAVGGDFQPKLSSVSATGGLRYVF